MDHRPTDQSKSTPSAGDAVASPQPTGPVVISVCVSCKSADGLNAGAPMLEAMRAALADAADVQVRPVQCLSVCKRPTTVAVTSADGYSFVFGDLVPETAAEAIASFAASYRDSPYGLVPWRQRAEVLRKGMVTRLPPLGWSPDDGRAPT
ncbi:DUF1636 domain-containing protein [Rhodopseudomonas sp. HC1]|uniref:DUF1636 family protein n=1 Tax=Rhodopseudomonas infernalis TaxID=2897386 RepID=UPI001EE8BF04|nr:DUF1636 domain-containing protein [Rhodopseudomonas infernalis]MCG6205373.1 DUF1636 domain-containing protein [Rhodopseudomonas infernalis]